MLKFVLGIIVGLLAAATAAVYFGVIPIPHGGQAAPPEAAMNATPAKTEPPKITCTGMVEATGGEIDVLAQMAGELSEVNVREGETVQKGQVLAVLDARRQEANVAVAAAAVACATAKLKHVQAGVGKEEQQEALLATEAVAPLLKYETSNRDRLRKLYTTKATTLDLLEASENQVNHLQKQMDGLNQHYQSLRRGPLPEEIELARTEVTEAEERLQQAKVEYGYRMVLAPAGGTVLRVYRHTGDSVSIQQQTPIVRLVDAGHLRIRLEIDETYASRLKPPREGSFQVGGMPESVGHLVVSTVIPQFGPKRLFNPDTSARVDTRILDVLCDIRDCSVSLYPEQRITAQIPLEGNPPLAVANDTNSRRK